MTIVFNYAEKINMHTSGRIYIRIFFMTLKHHLQSHGPMQLSITLISTIFIIIRESHQHIRIIRIYESFVYGIISR